MLITFSASVAVQAKPVTVLEDAYMETFICGGTGSGKSSSFGRNILPPTKGKPRIYNHKLSRRNFMMEFNASQPKSLFELDEKLYVKATLIKNSLYWVIGRNKQRPNRMILYPILTRLILFIQKPVSIIIYEGHIAKKQIFKSLDSKFKFGDTKLSSVFYNKIELNCNGEVQNSNLFRIFGTKYSIAFFIIKYDKDGDIEKTEFLPIERSDLFGLGLQQILEDQEPYIGQTIINISDVLPDLIEQRRNPSKVLENKLEAEFNRFPRGRNKAFERIKPKLTEIEDKLLINGLIEKIKEGPVNKAYQDIKETAFSRNEGTGLNNYLFFLKTATFLTESNDSSSGSYTLRAILCKEQKSDIKLHYEYIINGKKSCSWRDSNNYCLIKGKGHEKSIGKCLFFKDNNNEPVISVDEFIESIQKPFMSSRSFLNHSLGMGIIDIADVCPDFSRSSHLGGGIEQPFEGWSYSSPISLRHAATLCLSFQTIKFSDGIRPKAIITPLVINGITSMATSTISAEYGENENDPRNWKEWMFTYSRYLAVFSRMMTHPFRTQMKELYLNELKNCISTALFNTYEIDYTNPDKSIFYYDKFINDLNSSCEIICHIYPMQIARFSFNKEELGKTGCRINNIFLFEVDINDDVENNMLFFCLIENYFFDRLFCFEYITLDQARTAITDGVFDAGQRIHASINDGGTQQ